MNFYRRYIGDYARDTSSLSLAEHGAYALLLDCYYADGAPLPKDLPSLYRICRATSKSEKAAVASVADRFFAVNGDGKRHNVRADKELQKAKPAIEAARKNGARRATGGAIGISTGSSSVVPPTTNHQPPLLPSLQPPTANPPDKARKPSAARKAAESAERTRPTRDAYSNAYRNKYGVEPTWDRQANSMVAKFVEKIGVSEAPAVSAFFLTHSRQDYVRGKHDVSLMLRDARGLRTEWATGKKVSDATARQADATQARGEAFTGLLEEAQKREDKG